MRTRGASRRSRRIRTLRSGPDRNETRSQIHNRRRNEKRRDPPRAMFQKRPVFALNHFERSDTAADVNTNVFGRLRRYLELGRFEGILSRANGKLNKPPHFLDFFLIDELTRLEPLNLSRDRA